MSEGRFLTLGSDLTRCRLWQAEGFEAMEEGVRAMAKTSNFQSEHVYLKTIFFTGRDQGRVFGFCSVLTLCTSFWQSLILCTSLWQAILYWHASIFLYVCIQPFSLK